MTWLLVLKNIRHIGIATLIIGVVWLYKDREFQKAENVRQSENAEQIRKQDSLGYSRVLLTEKEARQQLEYQNSDVLKKMDELNINMRNVHQIVTNELRYRKTDTTIVDISEIIAAIKENKEIILPFKESDSCWAVAGNIHFNGKDAQFKITEREFKNVQTIIGYQIRKQWKLLGIKTRLFGKRKLTVAIENSCGETTTKIIDIKRKRK